MTHKSTFVNESDFHFIRNEFMTYLRLVHVITEDMDDLKIQLAHNPGNDIHNKIIELERHLEIMDTYHKSIMDMRRNMPKRKRNSQIL